MLLKLLPFAFAVVLLAQESHSAPLDVEWYHFGLIADMDKKAIGEKNSFNSHLQIDELRHYIKTDQYTYLRSRVRKPVSTKYAYGGRGAELSELLIFNKKLYSFDDKTGIVFRMTKLSELFPWAILANGNGEREEGFKAEWATIKGEAIYVGSTGIAFNKSGKLLDQSQWIKKITKDGTVTSHNWTEKYNKIRKALGIPNGTGFVWHEAAMWSPVKKKWIFMPRKCTKEAFTPENEEKTGCNKIITTDENFSNIKVIDIKDKPENSASGFSTFKFIPGTNHERLLALRTVEQGSTVTTWAVVVDLQGKVLMPEKKIYDDKYEGLAFFGGVKKYKA